MRKNYCGNESNVFVGRRSLKASSKKNKDANAAALYLNDDKVPMELRLSAGGLQVIDNNVKNNRA